VRRKGLAPGTVITDEIHLIADDHRGPVVEGLLSRLLASGRIASLCGLLAGDRFHGGHTRRSARRPRAPTPSRPGSRQGTERGAPSLFRPLFGR
jgi:hypothetical protein